MTTTNSTPGTAATGTAGVSVGTTAVHTRPRPVYAALLAGLLSSPTPGRAAVPGGRLAARTGLFTRIAVANPAGERVALVVVRANTGRLDPAILAPVVAAILGHAPTGPAGDASPTLDGSNVHTRTVMRRDDRTPARRADGAWQWTVPGATVRVERHTITVTTPTTHLRIAFDGPQWTDHAAAPVLDTALWQLAAPEAHHMTRTTAPAGWRRLGDVVLGAIGRDRTGGHTYSGHSTARCSCGEVSTWETRQAARWANTRHHAAIAQTPTDPAEPSSH